MSSAEDQEYQNVIDIGTQPNRLDDLSSEMQDRLRSIQELKRRGLTNASIARLLGCGEATVYRDIKRMRELYIARAGDIKITEEVGRSLELFDEIINKAMEGHRSSVEDGNEAKDSNSRVADHSHASRYLMTALAANKQKIDMLVELGMAQMMSKALEKRINGDGRVDVSKLRTPAELKAVSEELSRKVEETERRIHRINGPNPLAYDDPAELEKARREHDKRFEEYMAVKRRLRIED